MVKTRHKIPYNKAVILGTEIDNIRDLIDNGCSLDGTGYYSQKCQELLEKKYNINKVLLTNSGTAALEMGVLLADIKPGDEVIMPSYTFVSTANAVVLRGGVPVFIDINASDLNMDCRRIKKAITTKTKAIIPVHYGGSFCCMELIEDIAKEYNLFVMEDAAQGINSFYKNKASGTFGNVGAVSFHYTKNIQAGECGAIYINDETLSDRADIILEKGTNRKLYKRGRVSKYTWVDVGSSYCPSEITAAFLYSQLENIDYITQKRVAIWKKYQELFGVYESHGLLRTPHILPDIQINGHIYFIIMNTQRERDHFLRYLNENDISAQTHFVPLHSSEYGVLHTKVSGSMDTTDMVYACSLRMPLYDMDKSEIDYVFDIVTEYFKKNYNV